MPLNPTEHPEQFEIAVLGRAVQEFWDSRIGQYLLEKSLAEYNLALEQFKSVDPSKVGDVAKIQSTLIRSEDFREWLSAAISEGLRAEQIIQTGEFDDDIPQE